MLPESDPLYHGSVASVNGGSVEWLCCTTKPYLLNYKIGHHPDVLPETST